MGAANPSADALVFDGAPARAALAQALGPAAPAVVAGWLSGTSAPVEVPADLRERVADAAAALAGATEALLVHRFDARLGIEQVLVLVHDGARAVLAGGDREQRAVVGEPEPLDAVIARLAEEIGGCADDAPPHTARIGGPALLAVRAVAGARPAASRDEATARLETIVQALGTDASPAQVLDTLMADGFAHERDDGTLEPGSVQQRHPEMAAAADGSTLVLTRMSLSHVPQPLVYDVRTIALAGPFGRRCLVLPPDDDQQIGFARLRVNETITLLAAHVTGRSEPSCTAVAPQREVFASLPVGTAARLSAAQLLEPGDDVTAALAQLLSAPPAVVCVRRACWDRGRADGVAVWAERAVGWSWTHGAGDALVETRERAEPLVAALLAEHLADADAGGLTAWASVCTPGGVLEARVELVPAGGGWELAAADRIDDVVPLEAPTLAAALVAALNRAGSEPA